jgi:hypothetical protein
MKVIDAVLGLIEPFEFSDAAIEVALAQSAVQLAADEVMSGEPYTTENMQVCTLAAMRLLWQGATLSSESLAGVSHSYNADNVKRRIKSLAAAGGLSPFLVLSDEDEPTVRYVPVM